MFALLQVLALCTAADAAPGYTVHVRDLTTPERAIRVKLTGSVAVLDAVRALELPAGTLERMDLWIARRSTEGKVRVLRIDWAAITQRGMSATNYIVLAGDRLFVQARPAR